MDHSPLSADPASAGLAARRFAAALAHEALLEQTARLEATLTGGLEALLAVEQALDLAWPSAAPACELIWATEAAPEALRLRAFDGDGRLLLAKVYPDQALKHG